MDERVPPLGLVGTALLFGVPTLMLWASTRIAVPLLDEVGLHPLLAWYLAGGILVFVPLLVAAFLAAGREVGGGPGAPLLGRLRMEGIGRSDLGWAVFLTLVCLLLMGAVAVGGQALFPGFRTAPAFLEVSPLGPGETQILLAWLPFFFFNIVGEELWWRGYIQPRHEAAYGQRAWMVQAVFWALFHVSFGWSLMLVLAPVFVAVPWAVQRTGKTLVGVAIHGGVNAVGFLAVTSGLLGGV
jgi:membrane protease YdiL (CAAX protease family)